MPTFELFVAIIGMLMAFGYLPQIIKIFARKSAKDLSLFTYVLFFVGQSVWLLYGLTLKSWPIILNNGISLIGLSTIIALSLLYAGRERYSTRISPEPIAPGEQDTETIYSS